MTLSKATSFTIDANATESLAVAKLDATKAIVAYYDATATDFEARVIESDETVSAATTIEASPATGEQKLSIAALSATKAIVVWGDSTNGAEVGIISISGTTPTFESGSVLGLSQAVDGSDGAMAIVALAVGAAIVTYNGEAAYLTISGTTITEESTVTADSNVSSVSIAKLSSTKAIIAYTDGSDSNIAKATALSVSGVTISAGTPQNLEASDVGVASNYGTALAPISASQALCAWANDTDSKLDAVVLSVSGTTVTVNTPTTVDTWVTTDIAYLSIAAYSATKFALFYDQNMAELTISGTSVTDEGTTAITTGSAPYNAAVAYSSTTALLAYKATVEGAIITLSATTWGYAIIPSAGGLARDSYSPNANGDYLFFAVEDDTTGNQGVLRVERPTSTTPTTTLQYDPGAGAAGNVYPTGDLDLMVFTGNFGTNVGIIQHAIAASTNTDISPTSIGADVIAPAQIDPADSAHIVAINKTDEDMLESDDTGATWNTLQATLGVQVVAMALAFFGPSFDFGGFVGGNDGTDEHLAYSPNKFANQREDTSAALKAVGAITGIDIHLP